MTVRTTSLGGTNWAYGEVPASSDFNDTINDAVYKAEEDQLNNIEYGYFDIRNSKYVVASNVTTDLFMDMNVDFTGGSADSDVISAFPKMKVRLRTGQWGGYGRLQGSMYLGSITGNDDATVSRLDTTYLTSTVVKGISGSSAYDHSSVATTMIRDDATDCANPETSFATWGTEFDATEYSNTETADSNTYSIGNNYVIMRIPVQDIRQSGVAPICAITAIDGNYTGSAGGSGQVDTYVWSSTGATWVKFGGAFAERSADTQSYALIGCSSGTYDTFQFGTAVQTSIYADDDDYVYFKVKGTTSGPSIYITRLYWLEGKYSIL